VIEKIPAGRGLLQAAAQLWVWKDDQSTVVVQIDEHAGAFEGFEPVRAGAVPGIRKAPAPVLARTVRSWAVPIRSCPLRSISWIAVLLASSAQSISLGLFGDVAG
jgi:hypothetical protein